MKKTLVSVSLLLLLVAVLAACAAPAELVEVTRVVTETDTVEVEVTKVVETEVETVVEVTKVVEVETVVEVPVTPEPEPVDRNGGWMDTIVFIREPNQDAAIARLASGDIDAFADDVAGEALVQAIDELSLIHI